MVNKKSHMRSSTARQSRRNLLDARAIYGDGNVGRSPERQTTFGVGRSAFEKVVSPTKRNYQPHDRSLPGPGYYQPNAKQAIDVNLKYSMRPKTQKECKYARNIAITL